MMAQPIRVGFGMIFIDQLAMFYCLTDINKGVPSVKGRAEGTPKNVQKNVGLKVAQFRNIGNV